jgi:methylenetetrahydrofolate dehydrogenase (NADP+)/methenyltetrahydrofolate cyclohydrolase/formyltetrahydrofolate synthetase
VSFGSSVDSWFFAYEFKNGATTFRLGDGVPAALLEYINRFGKPTDLEGTLRVQLGHNNSFVVWSKASWACHNVPDDLRDLLCKWSSGTRGGVGITMGSLKQGTLINVQWNKDGTLYVQADNMAHARRFKTKILHDAWNDLWPGSRFVIGPQYIAELAVSCHDLERISATNISQFVAIDAHASKSETFALINKQSPGQESPFILHFGEEPVHARLSTANYSLQLIDPKRQYLTFRWATCTKTGRPHGPSQDMWELRVKKGQTIKVLQSAGGDWHIVVDQKGMKGYAHSSWLDFTNRLHHQPLEKPEGAWRRYSDDVKKMVSGPVSNFLDMTDYVNDCTRAGCQLVKDSESSLGICAHDLRVLLGGSGCYCLEWLKEDRNKWHPDRFARLCAPQHAGLLKVKAQQLFVLYGILMEEF